MDKIRLIGCTDRYLNTEQRYICVSRPRRFGKSMAIQQIKDRHYIQALEGDSGEILLAGINYDKDSQDKPHSCVIERMTI